MNIKKKDIQEAKQLIKNYCDDISDPLQIIEKNLNYGKDQFQNSENISDEFFFRINCISNELKLLAIANRFINNNIQMMVNTLRLSYRFKYIEELEKHSSKINNMNVFQLLDAIAIKDEYLLEKYFTAYKTPCSKGHKTAVLLSQIIYAIHSKIKLNNETETKIKNFKGSIFHKGLIHSLFGILIGDDTLYNDCFLKVLKSYNKQQELDTFEKKIALYSHSLMNLKVYDQALPPDSIFDQELQWNLEQHKSEHIDISKINKTLNNWILELPNKIDLNTFTEEIKQS